MSWPALAAEEALAKPPRLAKPAGAAKRAQAARPAALPPRPEESEDCLDVGIVLPPPQTEAATVPGLWSYAEVMGKERMFQERKREPRMPPWRPRRPAVIGALATFFGLIFVFGIGAGLFVRAVPEAAAASTQDDGEGRHRGDPKARPAYPASAVVGASCSDFRLATAPSQDARQPAVATPAAAAASTDLGDLDTTPAPAVPAAGAVSSAAPTTAPAASARRPAKPAAAPPAVVRRPPTPAPARAPGPAAAPGEQRSADVLFAGRL